MDILFVVDNSGSMNEIVYHLAIGNFRLERYEDARKYLEQSYAFFTSIQDTGQYDVTDRLVFVLDESLGRLEGLVLLAALVYLVPILFPFG